MAEAKGRVLISCFSTSLHRLQIVTDLAQEYGRRLCFIGRSMFQNSEIARQMGRLQIPRRLARCAPGPAQVAAQSGGRGADGQPGRTHGGALARGRQEPRWVTVEPGDDVVISARDHSRQREIHLPHDRPPLPPRRARPLPGRQPAARPRFRARQRGRTEADAEPDPAAILRPHSRRIPPALPPHGDGQGTGRRVAGSLSARKRRRAGIRRRRRAPRRPRARWAASASTSARSTKSATSS